MSENIEEHDYQSDSEKPNTSEKFYGVRDGILFLIDTSPGMFVKNEKGTPYFVSCIEEYIDILKQKLRLNRQDWMGLILFGTEKWDMEPEIKNILTLQKLSLVNKNKLKEAETIRDHKWKDYESMSSSKNYPLQDVLWHAALSFSSEKITMSARRVVLYTCHDVPPLTNEDEKHRIRTKALTFSSSNILLYVVGLGEQWNVELFYKDLEMLSRNITQDDYQRIPYKDLMQQIKRSSKNMAKLPWRIGKNVIINVDLFNLCAKPQDIQKVRLDSKTNTPLVSYTSYQRKEDSDMEENEDEDGDNISMPISQENLRKMKECGQKKVFFTIEETKSFSRIYEVGIDLIGVEPLSCDVMYHLHAPYFISYNKNCTQGEKLLFAALLKKCDQRNLKIICRVTMRINSGTFLFNMIPMLHEGGFYLYKVPYSENVNDFTEEMYEYAYDDKDKKPPINHEAVTVFENIIRLSSQCYNPENYPNPQLQVKLQSVEALALDLDRQSPPPDPTLPQEDLLEERIGDLTKQINEIFMKEDDMEPPKKMYKKSKTDESIVSMTDEEVLELVKNNKLDKYKNSDLQIFLRNAGLSTTGRKAELIQRLNKHYRQNLDDD